MSFFWRPGVHCTSYPLRIPRGLLLLFEKGRHSNRMRIVFAPDKPQVGTSSCVRNRRDKTGHIFVSFCLAQLSAFLSAHNSFSNQEREWQKIFGEVTGNTERSISFPKTQRDRLYHSSALRNRGDESAGHSQHFSALRSRPHFLKDEGKEEK